MVLVATARPGIEAERLEARIRLHLDRLAGRNGDALRWTIEEELERARRRALVSIHSELQSLEHRADLLSQYTTYFDEPERAFTESAALSAIEPSGVASFAADRLGADRAVTLVVRPESR